MKSFLIGGLLLLNAFVALNQAKAFLVTYDYVGLNYTTSTTSFPGFSLNDHMTVTLTLDSSYWGTETNQLAALNVSSGPFSGNDGGKVTTDASGKIIAWSFSGSLPGVDLLAGSGEDLIFGSRPSGGVGPQDDAFIDYPDLSVQQSLWTMRAPQSVPEPEPTALALVTLVGLTLVSAVQRRRARR